MPPIEIDGKSPSPSGTLLTPAGVWVFAGYLSARQEMRQISVKEGLLILTRALVNVDDSSQHTKGRDLLQTALPFVRINAPVAIQISAFYQHI